ncbi:MAG: M23 family metallopeptidase [Alphaproteobacteria bacterium]
MKTGTDHSPSPTASRPALNVSSVPAGNSGARRRRHRLWLLAGGAALGAAALGLAHMGAIVEELAHSALDRKTLDISLAHLARDRATGAEPDTLETTVRVGKGDTILDILISGGVARTDAHEAVAALKTLFDPKKLKAGQELTLRFGPGTGPSGGKDSGWLREMIVPVNYLHDVAIRRGHAGGFAADSVAKPVERQPTYAAGVIDSSLYQAGLDKDVPVAVMAQFFQLYSYDVDFQREIQPSDHFEVLYDQYVNEVGELVHAGQVRFAQLTLSGKALRVFHYVAADGKADYFDERGESVRKALLRTPIDGARLTSRFGMRQHPILGYSAMHRGIDFAAVTGTPIQAAGSGTVDMIGPNGGYGNYIRIRHTNALATAYAHLSGYAAGLRKGARVSQGQIIGFVGTTGQSTGPHLHYEVLSGNNQINPLSLKMAASRKLEGKELVRYRSHIVDIERLLRTVPPEQRIVRR